jgi:hypothetical protein
VLDRAPRFRLRQTRFKQQHQDARLYGCRFWDQGLVIGARDLRRDDAPKQREKCPRVIVRLRNQIDRATGVKAPERRSLTEVAGQSGCAGVKLRQQMAFVGKRQGPGDEERGALCSGSLCGSD